MRHLPALLALSIALAACSIYTLVDEDTRQSIAGRYSVDPQVAWSRVNQSGVELWTVDGPALESIRFYPGLRDGETFMTARDRTELPAFRADMQASEIMEFVVDSIARAGAGQVQATGLRPMNFGPLPGFRFELSYLTDNGLEMQGLVAGAATDGELHLIVYSGASLYYFPKYEDDVERIIDSIEML